VVRLAEAPRYREQIASRIAAHLPELGLDRSLLELTEMLRADFGLADRGSDPAMSALPPAAEAAEIAPRTS